MATVTESFNQADSTTLGPDLTWTETGGNLQTVSNEVQPVNAANTQEPTELARADSDLDGADHYAEAVCSATAGSGNRVAGVCVRYASAADSCYWAGINSDKGIRIFRRVTGTNTQIAEDAGVDYSGADHTIRLEVEGTALTMYIDDVEVLSATDSTLTSGVRCGIGCGSNVADRVSIDAFEAGDLAAAAVSLPPFPARRIGALLQL